MRNSRTGRSNGTIAALAAIGAALTLGAALAQGVQPPAVQAGPGAGPHGTLLPGNTKIPGAAGAVDAFSKGPAAAGSLSKVPAAVGAAPPASPGKATGVMNPGQNKNPAAMGNFETGPRGAGYLKSPTKGKIIGEDGLGDPKQSGKTGVAGPQAAGYLKSPIKKAEPPPSPSK